jgi:hypothetical protein
MCNLLHIATGPLSLPHSCGIRGPLLSISHETEPVFTRRRIAATRRNHVSYHVAHPLRKYTTSRECKPPTSRPIHTFGDLAGLARATAHLAHCNWVRMSSPGWNGGNLPAQVEVLWHLAGVFEEVAVMKTARQIACEARRSGFEAQHSSRLACGHLRRSSLSRDHGLRQGQLDRRPHANSNRLTNTDADTHANTDAHTNTNAHAGITFGGSSAATAFTDTSVLAGQTYFYVLTAVNNASVESAASAPVSTTVP